MPFDEMNLKEDKKAMDRRVFLKMTAAAGAAAVLPITFEDAPAIEAVKIKGNKDKLVHVRTLILDRPTKNMNVYPRKAVEEMVARIPKEGIMGQIGMPPDARTRLSQVSHVAKDFEFLHDCDTHEDWLTCEIHILNTPEGRRLREMIFVEGNKVPADVVFRTACQATISTEFYGVTPCQEERHVNVLQENMKLLGVHVIPKTQDTCCNQY